MACPAKTIVTACALPLQYTVAHQRWQCAYLKLACMLHGDYLGSMAAFLGMDLFLRYYYVLDNGAFEGSLAFLVRPLGVHI